MEETYCSDCKRFTAVVSDHSSGDTVCSECGLVLEPHSIDETSEWRTFGNETIDKSNPHRVGDKSNPLLTSGLTTLISKPKGGGDNRFHNVKTQDPDRSLIEAFKMIDEMSERLGLVSTIKDLANEIYKKMEDVKSSSKGKKKDRSKGKKKEAMVAACLYAACKKEGKSRTIKEIWGVANGVTKKEIGRAIRHLEDIKDGLCVNAGDFMRRFGSLLGMNNQAVKAAQEAVEKIAEFDIRRSPMTVVAAVIFMITQVSVERKLIPDVAAATGVAQGTIQKCYREIYPYASRLIPAWFANQKDLMMLCSP